jgi:DNA-binding NarL/FixJ family response regulator
VSTKADPLTVVIASDSVLIGDGLVSLLARVPRVEVVGRTDRMDNLFCMTETLDPEAVIVTVRAQVVTTSVAVETLRRLKTLHPELGIAVVSDRCEGFALDVFRDGSSGIAFLFDERLPSIATLVGALRDVKAGQSVMDPSVVDSFIRRGDRTGMNDLTSRETDILAHLARGLSNKAIAEALNISTKSIEKGITSIFIKVGPFNCGADRRVTAAITFLRAQTDPFGPIPSHREVEKCWIRMPTTDVDECVSHAPDVKRHFNA